MNMYTLCAPCHFGLESVLKYEISKIGGQDIKVENGKVFFSGNDETLAKANLWLRTAERVLVVVGAFPAHSFEELFQGVKALPLENYIGKTNAFPVKGWSINSQLHSIPDCQSIIKKAMVERLSQHYHLNWFEETGSKIQFQFSILKNLVHIMIDTSGAGLHKRGYRPVANAAGIADLARIRENSFVVDPFCGSGTLLIEAGLKAMNIAPGLRRHFAAERYPFIGADIFSFCRSQAKEAIKKDCQFFAVGSDIDPSALAIAKENIQKAGLGKRIVLEQKDISNFALVKPATILCNPPYGERLLDVKQAEKLYQIAGKQFLQFSNSQYYIISPSENFEQLFGKKASKRRKLYNGMLECNLFMYF